MGEATFSSPTPARSSFFPSGARPSPNARDGRPDQVAFAVGSAMSGDTHWRVPWSHAEIHVDRGRPVPGRAGGCTTGTSATTTTSTAKEGKASCVTVKNTKTCHQNGRDVIVTQLGTIVQTFHGPRLRLSRTSGGPGTAVKITATSCPVPPSSVNTGPSLFFHDSYNRTKTGAMSNVGFREPTRHQVGSVAEGTYRVASDDSTGAGLFVIFCGNAVLGAEFTVT